MPPKVVITFIFKQVDRYWKYAISHSTSIRSQIYLDFPITISFLAFQTLHFRYKFISKVLFLLCILYQIIYLVMVLIVHGFDIWLRFQIYPFEFDDNACLLHSHMSKHLLWSFSKALCSVVILKCVCQFWRTKVPLDVPPVFCARFILPTFLFNSWHFMNVNQGLAKSVKICEIVNFHPTHKPRINFPCTRSMQHYSRPLS